MMKYIMFLVCVSISAVGMQRIAILHSLADERRDLTFKEVRDARVFLKYLKPIENRHLLAKALWGLAAGWDDSFGQVGIDVAENLLRVLQIHICK